MGVKGNDFVAFIINTVFRAIQLIFACAVIGLYAQDLNKAHHEHKYTDSKWVFAVVIATFSAVTALVYIIPMVPHRILFPWDTILFILWVAVFGLFGSMYIHEDPEGDSGVKRMKNAVWVDLINMLLWLLSSVAGAVAWWNGRNDRSLHTGRARV